MSLGQMKISTEIRRMATSGYRRGASSRPSPARLACSRAVPPCRSRPGGRGGRGMCRTFNEGEPNILLTSYLTDNSRMMIHRKVTDRLNQLAGFLAWDPDPYLV